MKHMILGVILVMLSGCAVMKHIGGMDSCYAPTESEAKITKRVWK